MPVWLWVQEPSTVSHLNTALRHLLDRMMAGSPEGFAAGVVVFSQPDDSVFRTLRSVALQGMRTLALLSGDQVLPPADVWRLLSAGAGDVMHAGTPNIADRIESRLSRWIEVARLAAEASAKLIGGSTLWRKLIVEVVEMARFTNIPALVLGETGTGKELIAQTIHDFDGRTNKGSLVTVDCTNLIPELSGSELFGHEKGAFTGASASRDGAVALAHKGTLFLDEVGELPLALQAQLLRVLQENTYRRVGGNVWNHSEFRLVCATNRDLAAEVQAGRFRADLYYRIASLVVRTPPLRERREDILPLARYFLDQLPNPEGITEIDPSVERLLETRDYPGNVRELRQLVRRMGQRHTGPGPITPGDVPIEEWPQSVEANSPWPESDGDFHEAIRRALDAGLGLQDISNAAKDAAIRISVQRENGSLLRAAKRLRVTGRALQIRRAGNEH